MSDLVVYEHVDGLATIRLDDGKVNALSVAMIEAINAALDRAERDHAVVVMSGREGVFSAGFDLPVLQAGGDGALVMLRGGFELAERLLSFPEPVVVACTGHAIAMGAFLLLAADYRIGVRGAEHKITANEVAIGLNMPRAAIELCRQRLAPAHFQLALNLAARYTPDTAIGAGFLDITVPERELATTAIGTARLLAGLDKAAHLATKLRTRAGALASLREAIEADHADFVGAS